MVKEDIENVLEEEQEVEKIVIYNYKDISSLFGINENKALNFLKKFGVKIGHWQIEKGSLLEVLRQNKGEILI